MMDELIEVRTDGSALLKAVYLSRLRLTRLLLEGGAYINESNEHGETPLMVACKTHYTDSQSVPKHRMVWYLLKNGADPNIQDKTGKTALMHACLERAGAEVLSLLLSSGADLTLEDQTGLSALVYAVNSGNKDILRVLLEACKAKGKEVIIITTNKLPSGHQVTKQYLNVPPPLDLDERMQPTPRFCYPSELHLCSSAGSSPQPGSPLVGIGESGLVASQPGSPNQRPTPLVVPVVEKRLNFHKLNSEQWSKSPSLLLQQSQTSSLTEEPVEATPEEELSFNVCNLSLYGRPSAASRHHSIDVKDMSGFLKALEGLSGTESRDGGVRQSFGRKMSYDSAAISLQSTSHPNLHQDSLPFATDSSTVDEDSSNCLGQLNISSLQNVIRRRNIGINHYSSDSQLLQFESRDCSSKINSVAAVGPDRYKLLSSRSSTLSGSRESLESSVQRRATVVPEQRSSGSLLLDHIAHTRLGYLPPLKPHTLIPDIGVSSRSSFIPSGNSKVSNGVLSGPKPALPCASVFPKDLKAKKMLWRRHSMQSEQITHMFDFGETFGH